MAFRGAASQANSSTSTSVAVTVSGIGGTGPQNGDIVLFFMDGGGGGGTSTLTAPSGFSAVPGISQTLNFNTQNMVWYKVAGASEPSSYTATSNQNDFHAAQVRVYSGRNTSSPFTAVSTFHTSSGASPLSVGINGITAAAGDDLVILGGIANQSNGTTNYAYTAPSGYANAQMGTVNVSFATASFGADKVNASAGATGTVTGTLTYSGTGGDTGGWQIAIAAIGAVAAPFKQQDLDERVTTKVIASDFIAPNLLADQVLKLPPFTQKELPGWTIRAKGNYTDFAPPNLLADQVLKLPPFIQAELPGVMLRGRGITDFIHPNLIDSTLLPTAAPLTPVDLSQQVKAKAPATDFAPPNLLTQQTLKLPPFTLEEFPGWSLRARALGTDFTAPNLLSLTLTTPAAPLLAIDLSQQVKSRWVGSDFNPGNLLLGILPIPPVAPIDATVSIRAKGVFTDFSPPNLALSTLIPPAALYPIEAAVLRLEYRWIRGDDIPLNLLPLRLQTVAPIAPQDLSGIRLDARGLRSDFAPPNLTLTLPVPPPPPASTGAGRHGTRRQARRRRELDVLRARIDAFKEQRADADRALMAAEDREVKARSQILKRIRVRTQELPKPIEQYAPVKKALAQRNVAADRYKSILGQIRAHQLEAERIQREIEGEAADEEAALQLMHYLMMEIPWDE